MPDPNKLAALKKAQFKVVSICGTCIHFIQSNPNANWGTCNVISYEHGKHTPTDKPRKASVPHCGSCPKHEITSNELTSLTMSGFDQFRK